MFDLFVRHDILGCSGCQVIITHTHAYFLCICIVTSTYSPLPSDDTRFVLFLIPYCLDIHCIMNPLQFGRCVVPTTLFLYPISTSRTMKEFLQVLRTSLAMSTTVEDGFAISRRLMVSPLPSMASLLPPLHVFAVGIDAFVIQTCDYTISSFSLFFLHSLVVVNFLVFLVGFQGD